MDSIQPIMYVVIALSVNSMLFLLRRRLLWDWPMITILATVAGCAIYSITQGDAGIYLALGTLFVGFVLAEVPGRLSKRSQWARIQGDYRKAHRNSLYSFLLQPTAYNRVQTQMLKLVMQVKHRSMSYETAQEKLQVLQGVVDQIPNVTIHLAMWESLYAFAAMQKDWQKLTRNYDTNMYPYYCSPPSGAGFYMVQALCEEGRYAEAGTILQKMAGYIEMSRMIPDESEVFYNKARLVWLAHLGYDQEIKLLLQKESALYNLFPPSQRKELLDKAQSTDTINVMRRLEKEEYQRQLVFVTKPKTDSNDQLVTWEQEEDLGGLERDSSDNLDESEDIDEPIENIPAREIPVFAQKQVEALQVETTLTHDFTLLSNIPHVTMMMLAINIVIFVVMSLPETYESMSQLLGSLAFRNMDPIHLMRFGGCHPGIFQIDEGWRLFSGNFLHAGIIHLGFNTYFLLLFGPLVERLTGPWRFLNIYLISGLAGFFAALWAGTNLVLVGASASIFGVFGAAFVVLYWKKDQLPRSWYRRKMLICIILFVLNTYIGIAVKAVSFSAHMGGFVAGGLVAFLLLWSYHRSPLSLRRLGIVATLFLWLPLAAWTGERVYTTSQQSLATRLERLQPLGAKTIPMLLTFREIDRKNAAIVEAQIKRMGPVAKKALFQLLEQDDTRMQAMAAEVLGQTFWEPKDVIPPLYAQLFKVKIETQIYILYALHWHQFKTMTPQQIQRTVALLLRLGNNKREWVSKNILKLIFHLGPWAKSAAPLLHKAMTQHPNPKVRKLAQVALFKMR